MITLEHAGSQYTAPATLVPHIVQSLVPQILQHALHGNVPQFWHRESPSIDDELSKFICVVSLVFALSEDRLFGCFRLGLVSRFDRGGVA